MIRRRDLLNKIDFAAAEGICWQCAFLPPRQCHYRRYGSLPQNGARAKSDGLDKPSADRRARTLNVGDHEYREKGLKKAPAMSRKFRSFAPKITPLVS